MATGNEIRDYILNQQWDQLSHALKEGSDPNAIDDRGLTPLRYCVDSNQPDAKKGIDILLKYGARINESDLVGQTPLHITAADGLVELTEFLVSNGADTEAVYEWGRTPLHVAAGVGHFEIVKTLLASGADASAKTLSGDTAAMIARDQG